MTKLMLEVARDGSDLLREHLGLVIGLALGSAGLWFALRILSNVREALGA